MKFLKPNYKLAPHIILQEIMSLEENFFKSNMRKKDVTFGRSEKTTIYTDFHRHEITHSGYGIFFL